MIMIIFLNVKLNYVLVKYIYDKSKYNSYNYFIYYKYSIIFIKYKSPIFYSIINYYFKSILIISISFKSFILIN